MDGWMDGWIAGGYGASQLPMHLRLILIDPLCPKSISREPRGLVKVPDGPQTYILNILLLQKKGAQIQVSERDQSLTITKDVGRGLLLHSTLPTQWTIR